MLMMQDLAKSVHIWTCFFYILLLFLVSYNCGGGADAPDMKRNHVYFGYNPTSTTAECLVLALRRNEPILDMTLYCLDRSPKCNLANDTTMESTKFTGRQQLSKFIPTLTNPLVITRRCIDMNSWGLHSMPHKVICKLNLAVPKYNQHFLPNIVISWLFDECMNSLGNLCEFT
jgi:hypothetical protein